MPHHSNPDAIRAEQRRIIAETMSEAELQAQVIQYAKAHGWMAVHFRPAKTEHGYRTAIEGDKGSPDTLLARERNGVHQVYLWELKTEKGRYSEGQQAWLNAIGPVIGATYRPSDLERIYQLLA